MSTPGSGFSGELYQLEKAAKQHLPVIADEYGAAAKNCQNARTGLEAAMRRPEHFGGSLGPVHAAYDRLHDTIHGYLSETGTNLDETCEALHTAVTMYAETDQAALERLNKELHEAGMEPVTPGETS